MRACSKEPLARIFRLQAALEVYHSIYLDQQALRACFYFDDLLKTILRAVWVEQHAHQPARK